MGDWLLAMGYWILEMGYWILDIGDGDWLLEMGKKRTTAAKCAAVDSGV